MRKRKPGQMVSILFMLFALSRTSYHLMMWKIRQIPLTNVRFQNSFISLVSGGFLLVKSFSVHTIFCSVFSLLPEHTTHLIPEKKERKPKKHIWDFLILS